MKTLLTAALICGTAFGAMAQTLPETVQQSGVLRIANTPNYPPLEFRDPATNTLTGFDIDLATALAEKLGVKIEWQELAFATMLPALETGRIDVIMSGMSDLPTRHETATFVDYLRSGPQFFVLSTNADAFTDEKSVCGKSVGASRRTSYPQEIAAWSEANCGDNPVKFVGTDGSADARTQLKQGRIDVAVQGNETLPYVMDQEQGTYHTIGKPISFQLMGIAVPVKETAFQQTLADALDAVIADGTYGALLEKWQLQESGVEKATINGAH
ncbi:ABC transporter substrate-binding protein [Sinirhodobacter populi]|nr:ABC transporter substrate-binding protein [Sinirhodobacter populi]